MSIHELSIRQLSEKISTREMSAREAARAFLDRIQELDSRVRAFITVQPESVLKEADRVDGRLAAGEPPGQLAGVPLAVKDVLITRALPTTCGSRILENYRPPYDATAVARLRARGAVILGKTNCDEFAMGSSTENSAFFPTRNPWDPERVPGGSSGGSAAAVACGMAPGALGTDTGGSIRQPAAFCGVVGLKPTYGRVSRYGLVAFASSLDQIGPLTRSVEDAALLLEAVAGPDERDSTCSDREAEEYLQGLDRDVAGWKLGVPAEWLSEALDPGIRKAVEGAIGRLEGLGCRVREISLPHTDHAIAAYYVIAPAEASSNLARYDGVRYGHRRARGGDLESMFTRTRSEGFGDEVKRRIMIGTYALSSGYYDAYYLKASRVRTLIRQDYLKAFREVDLIVGPTTPTPPFRLGEKADPLEMYLSDVFTVTGNLAGLPGLSLPCAFTAGGLPVGLQLQAPHFEEGKLLALAHALEQELDLKRPPLPMPGA